MKYVEVLKNAVQESLTKEKLNGPMSRFSTS